MGIWPFGASRRSAMDEREGARRARARVPPLRRLPTVLLWSATRVVEAFLENEAWTACPKWTRSLYYMSWHIWKQLHRPKGWEWTIIKQVHPSSIMLGWNTYIYTNTIHSTFRAHACTHTETVFLWLTVEHTQNVFSTWHIWNVLSHTRAGKTNKVFSKSWNTHISTQNFV